MVFLQPICSYLHPSSAKAFAWSPPTHLISRTLHGKSTSHLQLVSPSEIQCYCPRPCQLHMSKIIHANIPCMKWYWTLKACPYLRKRLNYLEMTYNTVYIVDIVYCLGNGDKEKSLQKSNIDTLNPVFLSHLFFFLFTYSVRQQTVLQFCLFIVYSSAWS